MDQGDLLINCCQNTFYVIDDDLVVNFQVRLGYDVVFNNIPENLPPGKSYFVSASLSIFDQYDKVGLITSLDPQSFLKWSHIGNDNFCINRLCFCGWARQRWHQLLISPVNTTSRYFQSNYLLWIENHPKILKGRQILTNLDSFFFYKCLLKVFHNIPDSWSIAVQGTYMFRFLYVYDWNL